jgi:hypothetical protein
VDFDKGYDFLEAQDLLHPDRHHLRQPAGREARDHRDRRGAFGPGWTKVDQTEADAVVMLHGASEKKQRIDAFYSGGYGGWGYGGWGEWGWGRPP